MAKKLDEPKVRISRKCFVCGENFILSHPSAPNRMCEKCEKILAEMIKERRGE